MMVANDDARWKVPPRKHEGYCDNPCYRTTIIHRGARGDSKFGKEIAISQHWERIPAKNPDGNDEISKENEALTESLQDDLTRSTRDLAPSNAEKERERELSTFSGLALPNPTRRKKENEKKAKNDNKI
jgi:hypothetical protein